MNRRNLNTKHWTYDKVGNITMSSGERTGALSHRYGYGYDALDRLVSATQFYGLHSNSATDTLSMTYDDLWRVTRKSQRLSQSHLVQSGTLHAGYDMTYNYDPAWGRHYRMKEVEETHYRMEGTPTAADSLQSIHSYSYDPNGNLSYETVARKRLDGDTTYNISERKLLWDGMNHLKAISENGYVSLYWYDADGNRTVKEHGGGEAVWVNSKHAGTTTDTVTYSIYPNPYFSVNGNRWTMHYYIGGERFASKTGTLSGFNKLNDPNNDAAGHGIADVNYDNMCHAEEDSIDSTYNQFGVPYEAHHTSTRGNGWHLYLPATREDAGEDVGNDGNETADNPEKGQLRNNPIALGDGQRYFYQRDHLGSTMSVTDSLGNIVQLVEYTPWGEVFVERRFGSSGFDTPYLFNGKELDEETGLYYYGARYYDPKMSVWYSTDPMEMDYPWVTTYGYCMNNPVKLYDLNGEDWYQDEDGTLQYNPDVHSQRNLKGNQLYKFSERNYQKHGVHYRKDGSILYKNETDAYNRIWNQADVHYRNKGEVGGREIGGFILSNGNVLVLPDYQNDSRTAKISAYGYIINGSKLTKGKESFSILGQIHTHQEKTVEVNPSYYLVNSYGDLDISIAMNGKPVITIAHDGFLYALRGGKTQNTVFRNMVDLPPGYNTRKDLLNGNAKLSLLLKYNK